MAILSAARAPGGSYSGDAVPGPPGGDDLDGFTPLTVRTVHIAILQSVNIQTNHLAALLMCHYVVTEDCDGESMREDCHMSAIYDMLQLITVLEKLKKNISVNVEAI